MSVVVYMEDGRPPSASKGHPNRRSGGRFLSGVEHNSRYLDKFVDECGLLDFFSREGVTNSHTVIQRRHKW